MGASIKSNTKEDTCQTCGEKFDPNMEGGYQWHTQNKCQLYLLQRIALALEEINGELNIIRQNL